MDDTVTIELNQSEMQLIVVALSDLKDPDGKPGWDHPSVKALRHKLAAAIAAR